MHQSSRCGSLFLNSLTASAQVARYRKKCVCVCVLCTCLLLLLLLLPLLLLLLPLSDAQIAVEIHIAESPAVCHGYVSGDLGSRVLSLLR